MKINKSLKKYIEENIFPIYEKNEKGHDINHIKYVIKRSFKFAKEIPNINFDIVYTAASFHDIAHYIDPKKHEVLSAKIMHKDENLKKCFNDEQRLIIKEAIEDHRASNKYEPRSIYGKIISTADRNNNVNDCLLRSYTYGKKHNPNLSDEQLFEKSYYHLKDKFGYDGYAKFYFEDQEYEKFLSDIRYLLKDKEKFIKVQQEYINNLKLNNKI